MRISARDRILGSEQWPLPYWEQRLFSHRDNMKIFLKSILSKLVHKDGSIFSVPLQRSDRNFVNSYSDHQEVSLNVKVHNLFTIDNIHIQFLFYFTNIEICQLISFTNIEYQSYK